MLMAHVISPVNCIRRFHQIPLSMEKASSTSTQATPLFSNPSSDNETLDVERIASNSRNLVGVLISLVGVNIRSCKHPQRSS